MGAVRDACLPGKWLWISILVPFLLIALPRFIVIPLGYPLQLAWSSQPLVILGWFLNNFTRSGGYERRVRLARLCTATTPDQVERVGLQHYPGCDLGRVAPTALVPRRFFAARNVFLALPGNLLLLSILYTWVFNNAKGSILVAVLFHTIANTAAQMFPVPTDNLFYWICSA